MNASTILWMIIAALFALAWLLQLAATRRWKATAKEWHETSDRFQECSASLRDSCKTLIKVNQELFGVQPAEEKP